MNNLSALKLVLSSLTSEPVEDMGRIKSNVQALSEIISHFSGQEESFSFNPSAISRLAQLLPGALSGGGGNVIVPDDAPIQPPQAFVDIVSSALVIPNIIESGVSFENRGLVSIDLSGYYATNPNRFSGGSFVGNAFDVMMVDAFLALAVASGSSVNELNLSGSTNAEPTDGADNADIATLVGNGWTVTVNIGGVPTTFAP